ncbi:MAG: lipopolysaccharide heptosyltransferase II [Kiritimatiellae bacterium]|nr:lipopolysaccharide heptosyltransferase II [Kiritimatiellia bacterium]
MSFVPQHLILVSPNWLGDVILALPAFEAWRCAAPAARVTVVAKPSVAPVWRLCAGVDALVILPPGLPGTERAIRRVRECRGDAALLLPNSFRAAWIAWRARVPRRRGTDGQLRGWMLTERVALADLTKRHQALENFRLFDLNMPSVAPAPRLTVPAEESARAAAKAGLRKDMFYVALLPGAARGESKRWPAEHFATAALRVADAFPTLRYVVCGTAAEAPICRAVAAALGERATDLSGRTTLPELAALLSQCRAVCCNDSGGMHLAAATGVPVIAVFGLTDPAKTGPLGSHCTVIAPSGIRPARDIPRRSAEALRALASIPAERVTEALMEVLFR